MQPNIKDNRRKFRDLATDKGRDLNSPFNEAWSFTPAEYAMLQKTRPALFDKDNEVRRRAWIAWGQTSEGRAFRVR